jgi:glycosyltransferase involved in cell wall biosynthesis
MHPAVAPGGAQQVAYEMFEASRRAGHDAYLIAALEENHQAVYGKPGAPIVPMPGEDKQCFYFPQNYDFLNLSVGDWRSIRFFREFIKRLNPEVVHFHHYHRIGVESIRAARLAAPDAVISLTLHEMMAICMADGQMVKKPSRDLCQAASPVACNQCFPDLRPEFVTLRAARLKAVLSDCNLFAFPSEFIAERYVDWGLPADKCIVVPNGQKVPVDISAMDRKRHSPHVNRFGFFGQIIDNKGIDVILEALLILARENRVPPRGVVIEINGGNRQYATPTYIEKIGRQVEALKKFASSGIELRDNGAYDRHQLAERMASIDWVLVPSTWWEIFGLVVSEAWMFGRPVIASAIAALRERIIPGTNGYLFPARNARALADLIASLAGNPAKWTAANAGIEPPMTAADMLEGYVSVWEEIRARRHPPPPEAATPPEPTVLPAAAVGEHSPSPAGDYTVFHRTSSLRQTANSTRLPNKVGAEAVEELYPGREPDLASDASSRTRVRR